MLLETYTSLEGESLKKSMPQFLNITKEVTGDPSYSMFNLSLKAEWANNKNFCFGLTGKCLNVQQKQESFRTNK